ncbi:MAG: hypothetical protein WC789_00730 [Lentisphaeria bacterium]
MNPATRSQLTPRQTVAIAAAALLLGAGTVAAVRLAPTAARVSQARNQLAVQRENLRQAQAQAAARQTRRAKFQANHDDCWIPARHGNAETALGKIVEEAARQAGIRLTTLGEVRATSQGGEGVGVLELTVGATEPMEGIARFLAELAKAKPQFHWQRCTLRPDNPRAPRNIVLAGTLRVVTLTDPAVAELAAAGEGRP